METFLHHVLLLLGAVNLASAQHHERIVGGQTGRIEDYPWQVSLKYSGAPACGGSIIAPQWILTAAHCFPDIHPLKEYEVVAGITYLDTDSGAQVVLIDSVYKYPAYSEDAYTGDLALVKLRSPLVLGAGVGTITLVSPNVQIPAGLICFITGWGNTMSGVSLESPKPLQVGQVKIVSRRTCQCLHSINPTEHSITTIHSDMICAGFKEGTVDACQGDSGGPLSCYINSKWYQIGVVSWGDVCGAQNRPGVYIMPSAYITWIRESVSDVQVEDFTINQEPIPDEEGGCKGADGNIYPFPSAGSMVLVTFISLPLYLLSAYLMTNL